jgi:hypothetical protein
MMGKMDRWKHFDGRKIQYFLTIQLDEKMFGFEQA